MSQLISGSDLRTVHAVPLTPYDQSDKINFDLYEHHINKMYAAGIRVFLPAAGTSEFHSLSHSEIVDIVEATCRATGPDAFILAPISGAIGDAIQLAKEAMKRGAAGLMVMPLPHPYLCDEGASDYYLRLIDSTRAATVIYKTREIPSDKLLLKLAVNPYICGVKYAVNHMDQFQSIVERSSGDCEWLCGSAERFAPYYMLAGATGFTSGAVNLCPRLVLALYTALAGQNFEEAMTLQRIILPIEQYRARNGESFSISMLKYAMHIAGKDFGPARAPQRQLTNLECKEIGNLVRPILDREESMMVV
ncbi:dihydrodipicolinate synthase family protein [Gimesia aquarii]|uniref:Putative 5-dehydro-4-deoxyglucarate dehydratase n=1 Tax=Gimesia aquarii TaxID=2527964 RepID=A0A517X0A3_9PLAN|nr:dihydrodipicolinate synthase family protein [Gimesia aquarii]QDU10942.1 putative 5-dehydro-4-deoxyglucarate dehydratase [Gimesia aquarii]